MTLAIDSALGEFERDGYVLLHNALLPATVSDLNRAFDLYLAEYPEDWAELGTLRQAVDVLTRTSAFDLLIENPPTLDLVRRLLGEEVTFEEISLMLRDPTAATGDVKGWHRDIVRDHTRRHEIGAVSVVFYLTDVTATDHCFSIIPGSHRGTPDDLQPCDVMPGMEVDLLGPAGTALVFHARCLHAGRLKPHSRPRRTAHLYYDKAGRPRTSEWTDIPPRLAGKTDPTLPYRLFSKWDCKDVVDGTGRKPRDVQPGMSNADLLRIVQRRANQAG